MTELLVSVVFIVLLRSHQVFIGLNWPRIQMINGFSSQQFGMSEQSSLSGPCYCFRILE
jgi:hypothetical protein